MLWLLEFNDGTLHSWSYSFFFCSCCCCELHEAIENIRTKETMVKWNEDDLLVFRILIDERKETTTTTKNKRLYEALISYSCVFMFIEYRDERARVIIIIYGHGAEYATFSMQKCISFVSCIMPICSVWTLCCCIFVVICCCCIHICIYWHIYLQPRNIEKKRIQTENMIYPWPWPRACYQEHRSVLSKKTFEFFMILIAILMERVNIQKYFFFGKVHLRVKNNL